MGNTCKHLNVLLVDPCQESARKTVKRLRSNNEYEFTVPYRRDRDGAHQYLEEASPDLALLEHNLEQGTSMSLVREIRVDNYSLPIVILTDAGDERVCAEYFRFDVDDYRVKEQLTPDILHTTIKYALTRRKKKVQQKHAAKFDELTNLYNRRFTLRRINEELTHAIRHDLPFSLCLLDLDDFKRINDTHGHLSGDYLLKSVGTCLRESVRSGDVVGRYGGDEFIVGLRNTDSTGAYQAAQKLENQLAGATHDVPSGEEINVDGSIGMAEFDGEAHENNRVKDEVEELIDRADQALYRAKQNQTAAVERRRHRRFSVEQTVRVQVHNGEHQSSAILRNYSRKGLRLEDAPYLQNGKEVTLRVEQGGTSFERTGIIRDCQQQEQASSAVLGVEVKRQIPDEFIDETALASRPAS